MPNKSKGFFGSQFGVQSIMEDKARLQEPEAAGHNVL